MTTQMNVQAEKSIEAGHAVGPGVSTASGAARSKTPPEDVAHLLHLSSRQIIRLESDDYDNLPGATYVRALPARALRQLLGLSPNRWWRCITG